jgi:hypothetical protein
VFVNLVSKHGHANAEKFMLEYVIGGLKLTPPQPTFLQARDAIFAAVSAMRPLDLPDVKAGSVVEYTYKIASLDFVKLRDWVFQRDIPIVASDMVFDSPNLFQYGLEGIGPTHSFTIFHSRFVFKRISELRT